MNLLDRTPTPTLSDDSPTSEFVNSPDGLQKTSPTEILSFSSIWSTTSPSSIQTCTDDSTNQIKTSKTTSTVFKSTLECHQSTKIQNKSDSTDLEMDDPLHSPTLTSSIAYLEEQDLIPPSNSSNYLNFYNYYIHICDY